MSAGRICFVDPGAGEDIVTAPHEIVLDEGWVHVEAYSSFGSAERLRSYPASSVGAIIWERASGVVGATDE